MTSFDEQIGGNHYKNSKHQPLQQVLDDMGYEAFKGACVCKVLKYLKREKGTNVEDYKKAIHILELLIENQPEDVSIANLINPAIRDMNGVDFNDIPKIFGEKITDFNKG